MSPRRLAAAEWGAAFLLGAALLTLPWRGHLDDADAHLYQVVVRRIAGGEGWFDLRYLPGAYDHFREHLPFGFWPAALAARVFGEWALGPLAAIESLATLALVGFLGTRQAGRRAALVAVLVLGATESFWRYGGRMLLDPLLVLLGFASAVPVLLPRPRAGSWLLATALAAAGGLVKGPFGLLPLPCAAFAAAIAYRDRRRALLGAVAALSAALPVAGFLVADRFAGDGSWWAGYARAQLWASASGARADGHLVWWYPLRIAAGRFWPGLPLVLLGGYSLLRQPGKEEARDPPAALLFGVFAVALLAGLSIPSRKCWNHELIAFPALALLAGAGAGPPLARWLDARAGRERWAAAALWLVALTAAASSAAGFGARLLPPPCVASREFAKELDGAAAGTPVLVVARSVPWDMLGSLSAERRLDAWPVPRLPDGPHRAGPGPDAATIALLSIGEAEPHPPWREVARARGWLLLERP